MWGLLPRKVQLAIIVAASLVLAWGIQVPYEWVTGEASNPLKWLSLIVFLIGTALVVAFNFAWRFVWRKFSALNRMVFPDLNGTWEGTLVSSWIDPATNQPKRPIPAKFWITQNLFDMTVRMRTGESTSYSTRYFAEANHGLQVFRLWYSYDNQPKAQFAWRSARHEGVAWLELDLATDASTLRGQYFTQRKTLGDIEIKRISRNLLRADG
jgi:SMODS-associating 2TM, beta-strand rich effector domain